MVLPTRRPEDGHLIRVGIIGYGQIGRTHRDALAACRGARLIAVSSRREPPPEPGVSWHADYRELLQRPDIDLVAVCTPSGDHAAQALAALEAGKGVVVEKPLALSVQDGAAVVRAARERNLFLSVVSQRRTEPACRALRDALVGGHLGRPVLAEALVRWSRDQRYYDAAPWRGTRSMDGGVLLNQAIHAIDLIVWLLGPVAEVSGATATLVRRIEAEDTAAATLRFVGGAIGVIAATTAVTPGSPAELNVFAERGVVSLHDARVVRWEGAGLPPPPTAEQPGGGGADPAAIGSLGHRRQWEDIIVAFQEGGDPLVTGEAGLATLATILAVEKASRTGRTVRPDIPELRTETHS
ncbi:MAG TPA: Gfo/Idh/MocA family oxidoreductase [Thermomicrobiales bacterium]|jgi:predicted dehydrogenase|nr:Gfo/Idh/MocA family oxidoreductase [Thermomicrobiales bacterium]